MKILIATLSLALAAGASSVHAQSGAAPGAVLGAIAGGLIGGHNNDNWAAGAALGGVAGALIGSAVTQGDQYQYQNYGYAQTCPSYGTNGYATNGYGQPVYSQPPVVYSQPPVVYSQPNVVYAPAPTYCPPPVSVDLGFYSGPRYYSRGYDAPRYYYHHRDYDRDDDRGYNGRGDWREHRWYGHHR